MPFDTSMYQNYQGGTGLAALAQGVRSGLDIANQQKQQKLQTDRMEMEKQAAAREQSAFDQKKADADAERKAGLLNNLGQMSGNLLAIKDPQVQEAEYQKTRANLISTGIARQQDLPENFQAARPMVEFHNKKYQQAQQQFETEQLFKKSQIAKNQAEAAEARAKARGEGAGRSMTEAQSKSIGFGRRAMIGDQLVDQITANPKYDVSSLKTQFKAGLPKWLGGVKDPREQALALAKTSFISSVLRKESGAAVTPEEFAQYDAIYFPQPGDTPEILQQKKILRTNFIDTERLSAGPFWKDPIGGSVSIPGSGKPAAPTTTAKTFKTNEIEWAD